MRPAFQTRGHVWLRIFDRGRRTPGERTIGWTPRLRPRDRLTPTGWVPRHRCGGVLPTRAPLADRVLSRRRPLFRLAPDDPRGPDAMRLPATFWTPLRASTTSGPGPRQHLQPAAEPRETTSHPG